MIRRLTISGLASALVCALLAASCSDGPSADAAPAQPDPTSADLLNSVRDPGLGLEPSVPVGGGAAPMPGPPAGGGGAQEVPLDALGYNDGAGDAPVRVLEFSDFGCGYCRQFHMESYPALVQEYMDAGKVEWKYVPMVSGMFENSLAATRAAECAGEQDRFPTMRDRLFEEQQSWKPADDPDPVLRELATEMELDMERFDECVESGRRDERIRVGTRLFREVGGRGTPTFFVVGYAPIPGAIPLDLFRQVLDTAYVAATSEQDAGR